MIEVEIKVSVASLEPIAHRLIEDGAELMEEWDEYDVYYNAPDRDFAKTGETLRLRYIGIQECHMGMLYCIFVYKGPNAGHDEFMVRENIVVAISSPENFSEMLDRLGFRKITDVNKHRRIYQVKGAKVMLDSVERIGYFSEIEAAAGLSVEESVKIIDRIAERYGISGERLTKSYLEMVLEELEK